MEKKTLAVGAGSAVLLGVTGIGPAAAGTAAGPPGPFVAPAASAPADEVAATETPGPPVERSLTINRTKATYHGKKGWKVVGTARAAGRPWTSQDVQVQVRQAGAWLDVPGTRKTTDGRGLVTYWVIPKRANHYVLRLDIAATASTPEVHSDPFRAPRR